MSQLLRFCLPGRGSRIAGLVFTLVFACALYGTPITGSLGFSGAGVISFTTAGESFIDWCPANTNAPTGACTTTDNSGTGSMLVTSTNAGLTPFIAVATTGTIVDSSNTNPPSSPYTYLPVGVPVSINNYLNFNGDPAGWNWRADLLVLQACSAGEVCIGPFKFTQNVNSVSVSIEVHGTLLNPTDDTQWRALITGNFVDTRWDTISEVVAAAQTPAGAFSPSWSAALVTDAIPEPGTFGLLGGALLLMGSLSRRLRRK